MTKDDVIKHVCRTVALVYRSIGDYSRASDGFCSVCEADLKGFNFQHDGITLDYVRQAVIEKLKRDGFTVQLPED